MWASKGRIEESIFAAFVVGSVDQLNLFGMGSLSLATQRILTSVVRKVKSAWMAVLHEMKQRV